MSFKNIDTLLAAIDDMPIYRKDFEVITNLINKCEPELFVKILEEVLNGNLLWTDFSENLSNTNYHELLKKHLESQKNINTELDKLIELRKSIDPEYRFDSSTSDVAIIKDSSAVSGSDQAKMNELYDSEFKKIRGNLLYELTKKGDNDSILVEASKKRIYNAIKNGEYVLSNNSSPNFKVEDGKIYILDEDGKKELTYEEVIKPSIERFSEYYLDKDGTTSASENFTIVNYPEDSERDNYYFESDDTNFVAFSYAEVSNIEANANPKGRGYYEDDDNGNRILTNDKSPVSGKTYYIQGEPFFNECYTKLFQSSRFKYTPVTDTTNKKQPKEEGWYYRTEYHEYAQATETELVTGRTYYVRSPRYYEKKYKYYSYINPDDIFFFINSYTLPLSFEHQLLDSFDIEYMNEKGITEDEMKQIKALSLFLKRKEKLNPTTSNANGGT